MIAACPSCGSSFGHKPGCPRVLWKKRMWTPPKPGSLREKVRNRLIRLGLKKVNP